MSLRSYDRYVNQLEKDYKVLETALKEILQEGCCNGVSVNCLSTWKRIEKIATRALKATGATHE